MKISELFPLWVLGRGVMWRMKSLKLIPDFMSDGTFTAESIDIEYFGNHSGEKMTSPVVDKLLNAHVDDERDIVIDTICTMIYENCVTRWNKLWATYTADYNPIENYNMTETKNGTLSDVYNNTTNRTTTGGSTSNQTADDNHTTQGVGNSQYYAFNSDDPAPDRSNDNTSTAYSAQQAQSNTTTNANDNTTQNGDANKTENYTLKRSGNIGVTTTQQMLEAERKLWADDYLKRVVFPDVDRFLTINIY